jgi:hypothetical protein
MAMNIVLVYVELMEHVRLVEINGCKYAMKGPGYFFLGQ